MTSDSKARSVVKAATLLSAAQVTVSGLGLAKNLIAAFLFGTSRNMDVYLMALVIPDMAQSLSMTGLFNFIPVYAQERATKGEQEALRTAGKLLTLWIALLWGVLALCFLFAPLLLRWVAPGYVGEMHGATVAHARRLVFMAAAMGAARILGSFLVARKSFLVAALSEVAFQVASLGYLLVFRHIGVAALVWGMVFAAFCQLFITGVGLRREAAGLAPSLDFRHPAVVKLLKLSLPSYIGNAGAQLNTLVNRIFASMLTAGAVSALQYAYFMVDTLSEVVGQGVARALFPHLAEQHAGQERHSFARSLDRGLVALSMVLMPLSLGLLLLARPVVQVVLERGSFDAHSSEITVGALRVYAPALLAIGLDHLLRSVYYAQQNPVAPVSIGILRVAFTTAGCALLAPRMGHVGIALATTLGHYFKLALMLGFLRRQEQRRALLSVVRTAGRLALATASMGVVVYWVADLGLPARVTLTPVGLAYCALPVAAGVLCYSAVLYLLLPGEVDYFVQLFRRASGSRGVGAA